MTISIRGYASVLEDKTRKLVEPWAEVCMREPIQTARARNGCFVSTRKQSSKRKKLREAMVHSNVPRYVLENSNISLQSLQDFV